MREQAAFPHEFEYGDGSKEFDRGMTLREYAAIHLRVPNSGNPELDDMIREAQRNELAAKALDISMHHLKDYYGINKQNVAEWCYEMADAMLKEREK